MTHAPVRLFTVAPLSKKNNYVTLCPYTKAGRTAGLRHHFNRPNDDVTRDSDAIAHEACHQIDAFDRPAFPSEDLRVTVIVNARSNTMAVEVEAIRERPKGFAGRKRDLHGHLETLFDAIEGIVYQNDNQVAEIHVYRNIGDDSQDAD